MILPSDLAAIPSAPVTTQNTWGEARSQNHAATLFAAKRSLVINIHMLMMYIYSCQSGPWLCVNTCALLNRAST